MVEVTVMEIDVARKRISLSMKTENGPKPKEQVVRNKEQGTRSNDDVAKRRDQRQQVQKTAQAKKDADGDLQEKLAKLKGLFK